MIHVFPCFYRQDLHIHIGILEFPCMHLIPPVYFGISDLPRLNCLFGHSPYLEMEISQVYYIYAQIKLCCVDTTVQIVMDLKQQCKTNF